MKTNQHQKILITGGTRGIGHAIANTFLEEFSNIYVTGTSKLRPNHLSDKLNYLSLDLNCSESLDMFIEEINKRKLHFSVLINNAGINHISPINHIDFEDFYKVLNVNLINTIKLTKFITDTMINFKINDCRVLNICSIWSEITRKGRVAYSTSKSGLAGFTRSLAVELAPFEILVNSISPGFIMTDLTKKSLDSAEMEKLEKMVPLKRFGTPGEVAELALFLSGKKNTYITGQNIFIDGGFKIV